MAQLFYYGPDDYTIVYGELFYPGSLAKVTSSRFETHRSDNSVSTKRP